MSTKKKYIVVPWDFSEGSEKALKHAVQLAQVVNNGIALLYLNNYSGGLFGTGKKLSDEELASINKKLTEKAEKVAKESSVECRAFVRQGKAKDIAQEIIHSVNANLMVMFRHIKNEKSSMTVKDLLKIMKGAFIPFIIVGSEPRHQYYKEIVVPIDDDRRYRESLAWIIYMANYYQCNINLLKPFLTDEFRKKDLANNVYFTKKMLEKQNIVYGVKTAKKSETFKDSVFKFGKIIESDMIMMTAKYYLRWLGGKSDESFDIPIMCIPPRADLSKYSSFI
ncbi:MAG: universal stress protein [Salinivirgaceae bacterium]